MSKDHKIEDEIKKFIDNPRSFIDYDKILTDNDIYKLKKLVKHKNFDTLLNNEDKYEVLFDQLNEYYYLNDIKTHDLKLENILTSIVTSSVVSFTTIVVYTFLKQRFT